VQKAYLEFGKYLGDVRGTKGDQRAYDNAWRAKEGTPFQTTPSRFSARGDESRQFGRHAASLSESQNSAYGDPLQPVGVGNYPSGASAGMRPVHDQYYPPGQVLGGNHGIAGYERQQAYPPPGVQQAQTNATFYTAQQPPQMNFSQPTPQNWDGSNTAMIYNPIEQQPSIQQAQNHNFQGQNLQARIFQTQNMQAHGMQAPAYGYTNMPARLPDDAMGGATSSSEQPQGGPVRVPGVEGGS
jgi:hypothetical protein